MSNDPNDSSNWNFISDEEYEELEVARAEQEECRRKTRNRIIKSLSDGRTNEEIRKKAIRYTMSRCRHDMIDRYCKLEKLPHDFMYAASQPNGLRILVNTFFGSIGKVGFGEGFGIARSFTDMINDFVGTVYANYQNDIVYYRVRSVRKFLYDHYENLSGQSARELPADEMKNLLSAIRLHLNLHDFDTKSTNYILRQMKSNHKQYQREMSRGSVPDTGWPDGKKYFPHWKARHMKTLMYYSPRAERDTFSKINKIERTLPRDDYLNAMVELLEEASLAHL